MSRACLPYHFAMCLKALSDSKTSFQRLLFRLSAFACSHIKENTKKKSDKNKSRAREKQNEKRIACLSETNYRIASEKSRKRNENLHIFVIKILFFVSLLTRRRRRRRKKKENSICVGTVCFCAPSVMINMFFTLATRWSMLDACSLICSFIPFQP